MWMGLGPGPRPGPNPIVTSQVAHDVLALMSLTPLDRHALTEHLAHAGTQPLGPSSTTSSPVGALKARSTSSRRKAAHPRVF